MTLIVKTLIVLLLLFIVANLLWAGLSMVRAPKTNQATKPMSHHLGRRLGLSVLLLLLLILAIAAGWLPLNPRPY